MKSAVFLYNTQSGKCKIERCTEAVCTVFRAYGYDIKPQLIDFGANPFDGNEQIDLMVVAGGDGTVNYVVNAMKNKGLDIQLPKDYFPENDSRNRPLLMWRAHANTLYTNWINYYVYQLTPYVWEDEG